MSNIKISELPQATSVGSSDIVPIVQGGTTKKATIEKIQQNTNYSTTEQVIGTWIDGKPLYRTVVEDNTHSTSYAIDVASLNIKFCASINAIFYDNTVQIPLGFYNGVDYYASAYFNKSNGTIAVRTINNYSNYDKKFIIEYTKTTD